MSKNEFLPFGTAANANVLPNAGYQALPARSAGFGSGVAKSEELNTVWRQGSTMAAVLGQFIADKTGQDVLDDGNIAGLASQLGSALSLFTSLTGVIDKNGYISIPVNISGTIKNLLIQWGSGYSDSSSMGIIYQQPYSIGTFFASATKITSDDGRFATVGNPSKNGFTAFGRLGNEPVALNNFMWFSIGA